MNLANLDLNLLVPLDVLLEERSVTRAAARLGLSQPALSGALARLRRHFDDPLLVRSGNAYELTPLAVQLRRRTGIALDGVGRVFASEPDFDPSTSSRTFTVLASDYPMAVLGPRVTALIEAEAPAVTLRLEHHSPAVIDTGVEGLRGVDGILLPHGVLFDPPSVDLFSDTWVVIADRGADAVGDVLTMADAGRFSWVFTYNSPSAFTGAGRQLQLLGAAPRVQAVVESFLALPYYIVGTDRLALVQRRLARHLARDDRLRVLECPWDVVPLVEALWWHPTHTHDPEHIWLRTLFTRAGDELRSTS